MLTTCPECQGKVSDKATMCPHCGFPLTETITLSPVKEKITVVASVKPKKVVKKKRMKLPNGFGSIKKITCAKERYGVYPPVSKEDYNENGVPPTQKALCYVDDWNTGFYVLMQYKNGTFDPNKIINQNFEKEKINDNSVISKIIETYNTQNRINSNLMTFKEVYEKFYDEKFNGSKKEYSKSTQLSYTTAFKNCSALHDKPFATIVTSDMQKIVDECPLKHASLELITMLFKQLYAYAIKNDITDKDYSLYVKININDDDEKGQPFTQEEIDILWKDKDDPITQQILIMIYTGFRIRAFETIRVDIQDGYLQGGVKTQAGKNRKVPIHSCIKNFIKSDMYVDFNNMRYRKAFTLKLEELGILYLNKIKHTPHDCRHTFSWLCDKYEVDTVSKHLLMGHSLGNDVETQRYAHRTFEELKAAIEKIQV